MPILSNQDTRTLSSSSPGSRARATVRKDISLPVAVAQASLIRLDPMYYRGSVSRPLVDDRVNSPDAIVEIPHPRDEY
jgi:hypothetical protein